MTRSFRPRSTLTIGGGFVVVGTAVGTVVEAVVVLEETATVEAVEGEATGAEEVFGLEHAVTSTRAVKSAARHRWALENTSSA